jgi:hypothetical protein
MIVSAAELDPILNPRIRRRVLYLPIRHGKLGERKRCRVKVGGVYRLRESVPYSRYRVLADEQPMRSRAVLRLIDLCQLPHRTVMVTVRSVQMTTLDDGRQVWQVGIEKGTHGSIIDRPVYLARYGDYTTRRSEAMPNEPEVLMPLAKDLQHARARASERRSPQAESVARMRAELDTLAASLAAMKNRNALKALKLVAKDVDKLAARLSVDSDDRIAGSVCAECHVSVARAGA